MPKKLTVFIVITIFIIVNFTSVTYASFTPTAVELYDGKVIAYSEISAFKLTLANGLVISSASIEGDSEQLITETSGNVQVVLIIDVSGSMTGTKIEKAKNAAKTMVENLMQLGENTKIALVSFSSGANTEVNLTNSKQDIINGINRLGASGGTNMAPALDLATSILDEGKRIYEQENSSSQTESTTESNESNLHQYCVALTDGATEAPESCYSKLSSMQSNGIGIYGVLLESDYADAFRQGGNTIGVIYENINNDQLLEIYNQIFVLIYNELIENVISDFDFIDNPPYCIVLDNGIFITLDNELIQGARLDIEYVIDIKSSMEINEVEIEDITSGNIAYSADSSLLTENKLNSDFGWSTAGETRLCTDDFPIVHIYESSSDTPIIEKRGSYQKKIIYSKLLSSSEDCNFEHSTMFRLNNDSENGMATLPSLSIIITPPYGESNNNIFYIISTIILLTFITYMIIKLKHISKKPTM